MFQVLFLILIIFLFSTKSGGGGAKKWWSRGPTSPPPPRSLTNSAFDASLKHDLMSLPDKGKRGGGGDPFPNCHCVLGSAGLCSKIEYYAFGRHP